MSGNSKTALTCRYSKFRKRINLIIGILKTKRIYGNSFDGEKGTFLEINLKGTILLQISSFFMVIVIEKYVTPIFLNIKPIKFYRHRGSTIFFKFFSFEFYFEISRYDSSKLEQNIGHIKTLGSQKNEVYLNNFRAVPDFSATIISDASPNFPENRSYLQ